MYKKIKTLFFIMAVFIGTQYQTFAMEESMYESESEESTYEPAEKTEPIQYANVPEIGYANVPEETEEQMYERMSELLSEKEEKAGKTEKPYGPEAYELLYKPKATQLPAVQKPTGRSHTFVNNTGHPIELSLYYPEKKTQKEEKKSFIEEMKEKRKSFISMLPTFKEKPMTLPMVGGITKIMNTKLRHGGTKTLIDTSHEYPEGLEMHAKVYYLKQNPQTKALEKISDEPIKAFDRLYLAFPGSFYVIEYDSAGNLQLKVKPTLPRFKK